ncbi:MAG: hypothetical protein QXO82_06895 [Candidatus Methanomethylicia archaeon]
MEISEKERLMLFEKKEEIRKLTVEILDMQSNPENELEIKKKFISILSYLSIIASYCNCKNYNLNKLTDVINILFTRMTFERESNMWISSPMLIQLICNYINSIRFDFLKRDIKIYLPKIEINIPKITKSFSNHM